MNIKQWFKDLANERGQDTPDRWKEADPFRYQDQPRWGGAGLSGLARHSLEMAEVEEEVAAEQQGQIALVGLDNAEAVYLLARLRQQPPVHAGQPICREGFFTLMSLREEDGAAEMSPDDLDEFIGIGWTPANRAEALLDLLRPHDLILYLFPASSGWRPDDAHWFSRLRATGAPLLPVILLDVEETPLDEATIEGLRRLLGVRPIAIEKLALVESGATLDLAGDLAELVQRILNVRPRLAIPLAQEVPACRRMIARKAIRTGALMTLLLGSEPIPLLDLPLHVALQWKVALQLAAIYGRPGLDYRSREMAGTLLLSLGVRHLAQQAMKLVPFVGWLLSGLLSGVSTWLLGNALVRHYEEEHILPTRPVTRWVQQVRARADHLQRKQSARLSAVWQRVPRVRIERAETAQSMDAPEAQEIPVVSDES